MTPSSRAPTVAPVDSWVAQMRRGNFAAAWAISDAVRATRGNVDCTRWPRHEQFIWDGSPLSGRRVLVRCYHGLGDTLQFIRYAPLVRNVARELIVWAQPKLIPLLQGVRGIDRLLPLHDGVPEADYDVDVELMELPHLFRSTLDTLPAVVPYLGLAPASAVNRGPLEVGLVWQGGDWDPRRDIPLAQFDPLWDVPGVRLHALQFGPALAQWREERGPIVGGDPLATARAMQHLNLIITVDSFPAHLAGALGRPVWTLLHYEADWRWMERRTDSPWYPTMRLFRQSAPGDWHDPLGAVREELARVVRVRARVPDAPPVRLR
jgi:hypothetical protein